MAILFNSLPIHIQKKIQNLQSLADIGSSMVLNDEMIQDGCDAIGYLLANATLDNEKQE